MSASPSKVAGTDKGINHGVNEVKGDFTPFVDPLLLQFKVVTPADCIKTGKTTVY